MHQQNAIVAEAFYPVTAILVLPSKNILIKFRSTF